MSQQQAPLRIVSWNVNSLHVRLAHVTSLLNEMRPDILALQETKTTDDRFPQAELEAHGYHVLYAGQKSYNGVAVLARKPMAQACIALPDLDDPQRRLLAVSVGDVFVINVYVPNGQQPGSDKFAYKLRWLDALHAFVRRACAQYRRVVVLGDFNIAPADIDVHDPDRWRDRIMCTDTERHCFQRLLSLGLTDALRALHPEDHGLFTWWDYRLQAYRRGWGLRIDHILLSADMQAEQGGVARQYRALERPSDHAPVWVECR